MSVVPVSKFVHILKKLNQPLFANMDCLKCLYFAFKNINNNKYRISKMQGFLVY